MTYTLKGLSNTDIDMQATYINKAYQINKGLRETKAVTSAGDNGAFNVWYDKDGKLRGELQFYRITVDRRIFKNVTVAKTRVSVWLKKIR